MESHRVKRMLASTDGSPMGRHAVEVAQQLASSTAASLEVMSVHVAGLPLPGVDPIGSSQSSRSVRWADGVPGIEIVRRAKESSADVVVLGRDERNARNPLPLGRTADAVVRRLDGLCLLVPPTVQKLERVVLAIDGTRRGLGVLQPADRFVGLLNANCIAVHVLPGEAGALEDWHLSEPAVERVRDGLAGFPRLGGGGALRVLRGEPVWEILGLIERFSADLLILGVRGGGPRGEMGSGHVGGDLLRTTPVAVLTVPI